MCVDLDSFVVIMVLAAGRRGKEQGSSTMEGLV